MTCSLANALCNDGSVFFSLIRQWCWMLEQWTVDLFLRTLVHCPSSTLYPVLREWNLLERLSFPYSLFICRSIGFISVKTCIKRRSVKRWEDRPLDRLLSHHIALGMNRSSESTILWLLKRNEFVDSGRFHSLMFCVLSVLLPAWWMRERKRRTEDYINEGRYDPWT